MEIDINMKSSLDEIIDYNPFITKDNLLNSMEVSENNPIETISVSESL